MRHTTAGCTTDSREVEPAKPGELDGFWRTHDRDMRSDLWNFRVVWHEQIQEIAAREGDRVTGALRLRIAASLAHLDALYVVPAARRAGIGRALVARAEAIANYYNCHKVTVAVLHDGAAQQFLTACGYHVEAILPQHTFKLDVAMLRKFLL